MEDRTDNDALGLNVVEDHVGESADKGTTIVRKHYRVHLRMPLNGNHRRFDGTKELQTQPRTLALVLGKRIGEVLPGHGEEVRLFSLLIQGSTS